MWEGDTASYVPPASAIALEIKSTSTADAAAGTGARTVQIEVLNASYVASTITVTLNGTTAVAITGPFLRVNSMTVVTAGSGGKPAGDIKLGNTGSTVLYGIIKAGYNSSRHGFYTVPAGCSAFISKWKGFSGATTGTHLTQMSLLATAKNNVKYSGIFMLVDEIATINSGSETVLSSPIIVPEKCDIKISAISDASDANVVAFASFSGWIEVNPTVAA